MELFQKIAWTSLFGLFANDKISKSFILSANEFVVFGKLTVCKYKICIRIKLSKSVTWNE